MNHTFVCITGIYGQLLVLHIYVYTHGGQLLVLHTVVVSHIGLQEVPKKRPQFVRKVRIYTQRRGR